MVSHTPEKPLAGIEFFTAKNNLKIEVLGSVHLDADVNPSSSHYGWITSTPKENWQGQLVSPIKQAVGDIPFA